MTLRALQKHYMHYSEPCLQRDSGGNSRAPLFERKGHQKPQLSMNVSRPVGRMGRWEGG